MSDHHNLSKCIYSMVTNSNLITYVLYKLVGTQMLRLPFPFVWVLLNVIETVVKELSTLSQRYREVRVPSSQC